MQNNIFQDLERCQVNKTFYHGTSTTFALHETGVILSPRHSGILSEKGRKKNLDLVFLTPDYNYAWIYAGRCVKQFHGKPVVYQIKPVGLKLYNDTVGSEIWVADGGYIVDSYYRNML